MSLDPLFPRRIRASRPLVLAVALVAGLALVVAGGGLPTRDPTRDDRPRAPALMIAETSAADLVRVQDSAGTKSAASPKPTPIPDTPATVDAARPKVDTEISIGESGVVIRKSRSGDGNVTAGDYEFDFFEEFVEKAPWSAAMVFMVTALVFLVPVFVIALIIWYKKLRKDARSPAFAGTTTNSDFQRCKSATTLGPRRSLSPRRRGQG